MKISERVLHRVAVCVIVLFAFLLPAVVFAESKTFDRDLYGMRNDPDVFRLQEFLTARDFYRAGVTGNFFSLTRTAVRTFQQAQKISATGYFGPITRAAANKLLTEEPPAPAPAVKPGWKTFPSSVFEIDYPADVFTLSYLGNTKVALISNVATSTSASSTPNQATSSVAFSFTFTTGGAVLQELKERAPSLQFFNDAFPDETMESFDPTANNGFFRKVTIAGRKGFMFVSSAGGVGIVHHVLEKDAFHSLVIEIKYLDDSLRPSLPEQRQKSMAAEVLSTLRFPRPEAGAREGYLSLDPLAIRMYKGDNAAVMAIFTEPRPDCLDTRMSCDLPEYLPYVADASFTSEKPLVATVEKIMRNCPDTAPATTSPCVQPVALAHGVSQGTTTILASYATGQMNYTATTGVTIMNRAPVITSAPPPSGLTIGQDRSTAFSWTANDPDDDMTSWSINWDDGSSVEADCPGRNASTTPFAPSHAWSDPGVYRVVATALDCKGGLYPAGIALYL